MAEITTTDIKCDNCLFFEDGTNANEGVCHVDKENYTISSSINSSSHWCGKFIHKTRGVDVKTISVSNFLNI